MRRLHFLRTGLAYYAARAISHMGTLYSHFILAHFEISRAAAKMGRFHKRRFRFQQSISFDFDFDVKMRAYAVMPQSGHRRRKI